MIALETDLIQRPDVTVREFKNLDAALDFCKFAQPRDLSITTRFVQDGTIEIARKQIVLTYIGSEGML